MWVCGYIMRLTMAKHLSVNREFVAPPPLRPQRVMEPYLPCWCQSGKKWKWCHKDRDKQPKINIHERLAAMRSEYQLGYCSHPEASSSTCSDAIIRAHTVQRSGGLAAIAENGHVVSALAGAQDIFRNHGELLPREVGVRSASTFLGFCAHHDSIMFRPAEVGAVGVTEETTFLLSFRSVAYELFMKRVQLRSTIVQREADNGLPFETLITIQNQLHYTEAGVRLGLADLERWKTSYDEAYKEKRFEDFNFLGVSFSTVLPVVCCGSFHPEYDFAGGTLQRLGRGPLSYEHVTFNLTVLDGRSVAVFGWTDVSGPAEAFALSYGALPASEMAEAAVRLAFEHTENVYLRPSWWRALPEDLKQAAIRRMATGSPFRPERDASCLLTDGLSYTDAATVTARFGRADVP